MVPTVDLVLVFRSSSGKVLSRPHARENARQAERQYTLLLHVLKKGGLRAVGKCGEREGQLLVLVSCPLETVARLSQRELHSDFVSGLPMANPSAVFDVQTKQLTPANHLRLIHTYVTSTIAEGGLGVVPGSKEWDRVESVMALHDHAFNDAWIRSWTTRGQLLSPKFDAIRDQFGEAIALYFHFLYHYTNFLLFISAAGVYYYFWGVPYSPVYSSILLLWSITFVESWRIKQRVLSVRWGTNGSFRVEKRRAQAVPKRWWQKDFKMLASMPVIFLFAAVLGVLLTVVFVFEAFVTQLYTGPGHRYISFAPTILVSVLVPRFLKIYHGYAVAMTNWENHAHQSTHDASLTVKTFSLTAVAEYLGLALSAFVYVPFGEDVMIFVQNILEKNTSLYDAVGTVVSLFSPNVTTYRSGRGTSKASVRSTTTPGIRTQGKGMWEMDIMNARNKLSPTRLQDQMFASTVTNQVVDTFFEIGLPYVMRAVNSLRSGKGLSLAAGSAGASSVVKKKRVMFEDQAGEKDLAKDANGKEEREFMERVRREVALPDYDVFEDYREMVSQFGYVALWSTIWPLAPVMSLLNNWFEMRSDAFKIAVHTRRPLPSRTDTIGPWLDSLTFLSWLATLTNSALVYLFRPSDHCKPLKTSLERNNHHLSQPTSSSRQLLLSALLIALAASHGYIIVRVLIRHVLERVLWRGSEEQSERERVETLVKEHYLKSLGVADVVSVEGNETTDTDLQGDLEAFWMYDEGLDELTRETKES
ncbi:DUF590-domain-containing protein [Sparassis latifolia]|uniref:DUF590-domain-containing protein n=1 Tax=Sparassis crispa TaxID=139825 RepID=A0A401GVN4_9APHY|nr:predicted protein [Sparassis crispa]GBE86287.1 predicted protein [Sparassis crispa]